jgi:hypothetical protein
MYVESLTDRGRISGSEAYPRAQDLAVSRSDVDVNQIVCWVFDVNWTFHEEIYVF